MQQLWLALALLTSLGLPGAQASNFKLTDTWTFHGHQGEMNWGSLSPDGRQVYTQSGTELFTWDAQSGQLLSSHQPAEKLFGWLTVMMVSAFWFMWMRVRPHV